MESSAFRHSSAVTVLLRWSVRISRLTSFMLLANVSTFDRRKYWEATTPDCKGFLDQCTCVTSTPWCAIVDDAAAADTEAESAATDRVSQAAR
eukprot:5108049-Amphidinium_carterae.1